MSLIKDSYIADLKKHSESEIDEIIGGIVPLKKEGKNMKGLCAFHNEKTPSMVVSKEKGSFKCFGCGVGGSALDFIQDYYSLPFNEAVKRLADLSGFRPVEYQSENSDDQPKINYRRPKEALAEASKLYLRSLAQDKKALGYVRSRGITHKDIERFSIGFAPNEWDFLPSKLIPKLGVKALHHAGLVSSKPESKRVWDFFRDRLMFPVRNTRGEVIAFGGRLLLSDPAELKKYGKYKNSPEGPLFTKGEHLYGLYESLQERSPENQVINVVEGYLDVISMHRNSHTNTVSNMGTAITQEQIKKLFKYCDHIRFIFDGDSSGYNAAYKAVMTALPYIDGNKKISVTVLPEGFDPDSLLNYEKGREALDGLMKKSVPASEFIISHLKRYNAGNDAESKAKMIKQVNSFINKAEDPVFKRMLTMSISKALSLPVVLTEQCLSISDTPGSVLLNKMSQEAIDVINNANPCILKYCGLLLKDSNWNALMPLPEVNGKSDSDNTLIDFTKRTLELARDQDLPPETIYQDGLNSMVQYLQNKSGSRTKEHIEIISNIKRFQNELMNSKKKSDAHIVEMTEQ